MGVRSLPISKDEFARMFQKCVPPVGWLKHIGVANSGGPDSTCLLFLIHRFLSDEKHISTQKMPHRAISLSVDHDLQQSSSAMAEHCAKFAKSLGVQHTTSKIPWSQPPFPPKPSEGQSVELIARTARYFSLFQAMTQQEIDIIALGHHADDQVETSLIRLSWGSTAIGAGGMRPCRRWGMGIDRGGDNAFFGYEGMNRWIVRPLLNVDKGRILATCEENNLGYVTDTTNFQPSMTLRNAIRHEIRRDTLKQVSTRQIPYPPAIMERLKMLQKTAHSFEDVSITLESPIDELRRAVNILASNVDDIDHRVDSVLRRCSLPTLTGTFLLSHDGISQVRDATVRRALVLRVMRYTSYHPWGSMRADAGRRKISIDQIVDRLWSPVHGDSVLLPFTTGGGVLWTPVLVRDDVIKTPQKIDVGTLRSDDKIGWLASRMPPMNRQKLLERGLPNNLEIDVTKPILEGLQACKAGGSPVVSVLYDCRFLVRFNLGKTPEHMALRLSEPQRADKIILRSDSRWYTPKAVLQSSGALSLLHNKITEKATKSPLGSIQPQAGQRPNREHYVPVDSGWITMEWIRPITAI